LIPGSVPPNIRLYRYPYSQKSEIERMVAEMLKAGIIQPSKSSFSNIVVLVHKKDGSWPTEKPLNWWIQNKWCPKGEIQLQLGYNGFFIVIFDLLEDGNRIFEGGPYFFNYLGLYMQY